MFQNQWLIIGISGVTCGGKSTLATALYNYFTNNKNRTIFNSNIIIEDTALISQDKYFLPKDDPRHQWIKKLNHCNWEIMSALDMIKMRDDILNLLSEGYILYKKDLNNSIRRQNKSVFNSINVHNNENDDKSLMTIDASTNTNNIAVANTTNLTTTMSTTSFQNNEAKRIKVLIIEGFLIFNHPQILSLCQLRFFIHLPYEKCYERRIRRVYDPPDVIGYFEMCVWPMYEKHYEEIKDIDGIYMLNGETPKEKIFKYVLNCINHFL